MTLRLSLLLGAILTASGCSMPPDIDPPIYPGYCTRQRIGVGDAIVKFEQRRSVGVETIRYAGVDEHGRTKVFWGNGEGNLEMHDSASGYTPLVIQGVDGRPVHRVGPYLIVVYSASPEHLDYALVEEHAGPASTLRVFCPSPQ